MIEWLLIDWQPNQNRRAVSDRAGLRRQLGLGKELTPRAPAEAKRP
jgi:hypothetical protein